MRFVTYQTAESVGNNIEYLRVQGEKEIERVFSRFERIAFVREEDGNRAFRIVLDDRAQAHVVSTDMRVKTVQELYGRRKRHPKDWTPELRTKWHVSLIWEFS